MYRIINNSIYGDWPWGVDRIRVTVATGICTLYMYTLYIHLYNYIQHYYIC